MNVDASLFKILIVDDEKDICEAVGTFLKHNFFDVTTTSSSNYAMKLLDENTYHVLLSDFYMEELNGLELIKYAKSKNHDIITLVMTGNPSVKHAVEIIREGAYDYFVKPFAFSSLLKTIEQALEKQNLAKENIQLKEVLSLYIISSQLGMTLSLDTILNSILSLAIRELNADSASIFLYNEKTTKLQPANSIGIPNEYFHKSMNRSENGIVEWVISHNEPLILQNKLQDENLKSFVDKRNIRSAICIPLRAEGEIVGVLNVSITQKNKPDFTENQLKALTIIGSSAAMAIKNARLHQDLKENFYSSVRSLANAVEAKDPYTRGHSDRVVKYALKIGRKLNFDSETLEKLRLASILHDIGKIGIPESILLKPDKLTDEEFHIMKNHPVIGEKILSPVDPLLDVRKWIYQHHERYDGKGYPDGLKKDEILLPGRILIVSEVFDALVTKRAYKSAWSIKKTIEYLRENSKTHFDPDIVEIFTTLLEQESEDFEQITDQSDVI
jgi:response regulator RpfG family c-di-GMP phosphodiesterase